MSGSDELRALLGLTADMTLELLSEHLRPAEAVGDGKPSFAHDPGESVDKYPPVFTPVDLPWPAPVGQADYARDLFVTEMDRDVAVVTGSWQVLDGALVEVDSRVRAVLVHRDDGGERVLELLDGSARVMRIAGAARRSPLDALSWPLPTPARPELPVPDLSGLTNLDEVEPWLASAVAAGCSSESSEARGAAVGLLLRLFHPASGEGVERRLARIKRGEVTVERRWAEAWAEGVSEAAWTALDDDAEVEVGRITDLVDGFTTLFCDHREGATAVGVALFTARDELQSLLHVLRLGGRGEALASSLRALDREVGTHLTALEAALQGATLDFDRLAAVSWQEPEAWWGAFMDLQCVDPD